MGFEPIASGNLPSPHRHWNGSFPGYSHSPLVSVSRPVPQLVPGPPRGLSPTHPPRSYPPWVFRPLATAGCAGRGCQCGDGLGRGSEPLLDIAVENPMRIHVAAGGMNHHILDSPHTVVFFDGPKVSWGLAFGIAPVTSDNGSGFEKSFVHRPCLLVRVSGAAPHRRCVATDSRPL